MIAYRIKYESYISEMYLPEKGNGFGVVYLAGLPASRGKNKLSELLVENGFTVFQPFYSGFGDSGGLFTPTNCINDASSYAKMALRPIQEELYYGEKMATGVQKLILVGSSFGGSIAALSSEDDYQATVLLAPVLDYKDQALEADLKGLIHFLQFGQPFTVRMGSVKAWEEFFEGEGDGSQIKEGLMAKQKNVYIFHGTMDSTVSFEGNFEILSGILPLKPNIQFTALEGATHKSDNFACEDVLEVFKNEAKL